MAEHSAHPLSRLHVARAFQPEICPRDLLHRNAAQHAAARREPCSPKVAEQRFSGCERTAGPLARSPLRAATVRESETSKRPLPFRQSDNGRAKLLLSRTAGLMRASEQNSGRKARATGSGPSGTPPEQRPSASASGSNAAQAFPFAASRETSSLQSTHTGKSGVIHCEKISPRSLTVAAHDCPIASR